MFPLRKKYHTHSLGNGIEGCKFDVKMSAILGIIREAGIYVVDRNSLLAWFENLSSLQIDISRQE